MAGDGEKPRATVERFLDELGVSWVTPVDWDESAVYVEVSGEAAAFPAAEAVARAYARGGFSFGISEERRDLRRYLGRRGTEKLSCHLLEPLTVRGRRIRGNAIRLEWQSGLRPPIAGGGVDWHGRRWPAFFDEPCLYFEARDLLIIEGRIPPIGFASCLARYREWAMAAGLVDHREYEPDLDGEAGYADLDFVATIQDRSPYVTLSVRRRDPDELRGT